MVFGACVQIFRLIRVMLQRRNRANEVSARIENIHHGPLVYAALHASAHLIPAAHCAALRYALVVRTTEGHALFHHALGNAWTAVYSERSRV
jgi:hypothetical protein